MVGGLRKSFCAVVLDSAIYCRVGAPRTCVTDRRQRISWHKLPEHCTCLCLMRTIVVIRNVLYRRSFAQSFQGSTEELTCVVWATNVHVFDGPVSATTNHLRNHSSRLKFEHKSLLLAI
eukprot:scaffold14698_cov196-Amphora_coffeaeformis.AAC.8